VGSHELIGATKIDLETRFYNKEWTDLKFKPIEYRTLWSPSSSNPQGQLKMWVDIMTPEEAKSNPPENIAPPSPITYELRVIIWETKEVVFKDKNSSDIFVTCYPEGQKPQVTDTHWRSENGKGSFNWRMKFPLTVPCKLPKFKIQVWDKDILSPNDAIAEANLNLRSFFNKAYKKKSSSESLKQQWLKMTHPSATGIQGQVLVSMELLSQDEVARKPAGYGRKEPNENPTLPEPDRPESSFNPFRLDKQFNRIGKMMFKKYKKKIILCAIITSIILILVLILYFLL